MRISITHHQLNLRGGMETYLHNLINGFREQQDEVTVFVYKKHYLPNPTCEVRRTNLTWLPRILRKYWFAGQLHKQKKLQEFNLKISLMRSFHQDIIVCGGTHRGYLKYTHQKPSLMDRVEIAYEQKSYDTASYVVAHSPQLKEELINFYQIPADKILMTYPPIDTHLFNQQHRLNKLTLQQKYCLSSEKVTILFPSTGHRRKGFFALMEAMKKLPADKYELVIAGNQPIEVSSNQIKYLGFVDDMAELYSACDITILPSHYEPFGLVVIESIACGTPVIISQFVGAKDLISSEEGIILDDLSPDSIAKAIELAAAKKYNIRTDFVKHMQLTIKGHITVLKKSVNG